MDPKDVFYTWFPAALRLPVLLFLFFVMLTANGIFPGSMEYVSNGMGIWPQHLNFAYNGLFIGVSIGLMLEGRLKQRFSGKTLLLIGLSGMLAMNAVCATNVNPVVLCIACLLLGVLKVSAFTEIFLIWLFIWSPERQPSRVYPFMYATVLAGSGLMNWLMTQLAETYNWRISYILVLLLLLVCMLVVICFIRFHPLKKVVPLYQIDRSGIALLGSSMLLLNYFLIYGGAKDWLKDPLLQWSLFGAGLLFLLFLRRELTVRHPLIPPSLFSVKNLGRGLLIFFLVGMFTPMPVQLAFGGVLQLEPLRMAELNLYMIPGIFAAAIISFWCYYKLYDTKLLIFTGFTAMTLCQWLLFISLSGDFPKSGFWCLSIAKGYGTTVLFITYGLYTISNFEPSRIMAVAGMMVLVRSFITNAVFTAFQGYFLASFRRQYFQQLTSGYPGNLQGSDLRYVEGQAILLSAKELTGYILAMGILVCFLMAAYAFLRLLKKWKPMSWSVAKEV